MGKGQSKIHELARATEGKRAELAQARAAATSGLHGTIIKGPDLTPAERKLQGAQRTWESTSHAFTRAEKRLEEAQAEMERTTADLEAAHTDLKKWEKEVEAERADDDDDE